MKSNKRLWVSQVSGVDFELVCSYLTYNTGNAAKLLALANTPATSISETKDNLRQAISYIEREIDKLDIIPEQSDESVE